VPETPEELYARAAGSLRMPPVETWETFPFDGTLQPRALQPPVKREEPRRGAGGVDCWNCAASDDEFVWVSERWRLLPLREPAGLPVVLLLLPRRHYADPGDLPDELAAELGLRIARIERAIRSIGEIGRVHVCRWGDGSEHLHWWFMARPARLPQLVGSFAAIWDDVLPPTPADVWRANVAAVVAALEAEGARPPG
jgi:diadenosine tetraphosphate (Ap4A) HIT family hydrolase